ncbi:MAG: hypothetical protein U0401_20595 [Anaerolineae bacterium]
MSPKRRRWPQPTIWAWATKRRAIETLIAVAMGERYEAIEMDGIVVIGEGRKR